MSTGSDLPLPPQILGSNRKGIPFFFKAYLFKKPLIVPWEFPGSSIGKESAYSSGDLGSIPGLGRSPGERYGNPLQYSCLENPMPRGAWWATVHGVARVGHNLATKPIVP